MSTDVPRALTDALPREAFREPVDDTWAVGGALPRAVVEPGSSEEVRAVLAAGSAAGLTVVPLGGRTDPGAEPPRGPFVVLSTRRLAGIEAYEPADLTVTVGAGTTVASLGAALAEKGQWLPVDPPFAPERTVGGLVATGAAGPLGMAYGAPRDHVLGLTVVSGDGRVLRLGGRVMKNVAGFDLVKLIVGSRGTLGVVISATLRVFPRPADDRAVVLEAEGPGPLLGSARGVLTATVVPASAVLVSPSPGDAPGRSALVVRVQGAPAAVEVDTRTLLGSSRAGSVSVGGDAAQRIHEAVRDRAARHPVVLRAFALPALLPEILAAVHDAVSVDALAADVMSGRVRVGAAAAPEASALRALRARLEALGGSLVLERAGAGLLAEVPAYGQGGRAGALGAALRTRFDPGGVLSAGRFAP
ncbi:MAG: FAD-binding oxidoreductase [Longimicrobiales bacterium]|nr:FAD-binding oxidoreductase [Longimicrobiales bacterium]